MSIPSTPSIPLRSDQDLQTIKIEKDPTRDSSHHGEPPSTEKPSLIIWKANHKKHGEPPIDDTMQRENHTHKVYSIRLSANELESFGLNKSDLNDQEKMIKILEISIKREKKRAPKELIERLFQAYTSYGGKKTLKSLLKSVLKPNPLSSPPLKESSKMHSKRVSFDEDKNTVHTVLKKPSKPRLDTEYIPSEKKNNLLLKVSEYQKFIERSELGDTSYGVFDHYYRTTYSECIFYMISKSSDYTTVLNRFFEEQYHLIKNSEAPEDEDLESWSESLKQFNKLISNKLENINTRELDHIISFLKEAEKHPLNYHDFILQLRNVISPQILQLPYINKLTCDLFLLNKRFEIEQLKNGKAYNEKVFKILFRRRIRKARKITELFITPKSPDTLLREALKKMADLKAIETLQKNFFRGRDPNLSLQAEELEIASLLDEVVRYYENKIKSDRGRGSLYFFQTVNSALS